MRQGAKRRREVKISAAGVTLATGCARGGCDKDGQGFLSDERARGVGRGAAAQGTLEEATQEVVVLSAAADACGIPPHQRGVFATGSKAAGSVNPSKSPSAVAGLPGSAKPFAPVAMLQRERRAAR